MRYLFSLVALFALSTLTTSLGVAADETKKEKDKDLTPAAPAKSDIDIVNLTVYPAPLPRPVLKYRLLPAYLEMAPGNAATLYHRRFRRLDMYFRDRQDGVSLQKINDLLEAPIDKLSKEEEVGKFLNDFSLNEIEIATRRMECDWGFPIRESENPLEILLPELQDCRNIAKIIALKARLRIAEDSPHEVIGLLRTGYALSRHIAQAPFLVNVAVGNAMANMMSEQLLEETQLKDAPNLYWALTNLPHPFIDSGEAFDYELGGVIFLVFKELQEARTDSHSAEQWQEVWTRFVEKHNQLVRTSATNDKPSLVDAEKTLKENYPLVCEQLKTRGWSEKDIASKAPPHLLLLYCGELCEEVRDEELKWTRVPFSQLPEDLFSQEQTMFQRSSEIEIVPLLNKAAALTILVNMARTEQLFAVLRTTEALRLYASNHEGKLPAALEEIKEVPVPLDPWTNKAVVYRLDGDIAVISVRYAPNRDRMEMSKQATREYHVKIAK